MPEIHLTWHDIEELAASDPKGAALQARRKLAQATEGLRKATWGASAIAYAYAEDLRTSDDAFSEFANAPFWKNYGRPRSKGDVLRLAFMFVEGTHRGPAAARARNHANALLATFQRKDPAVSYREVPQILKEAGGFAGLLADDEDEADEDDRDDDEATEPRDDFVIENNDDDSQQLLAPVRPARPALNPITDAKKRSSKAVKDKVDKRASKLERLQQLAKELGYLAIRIPPEMEVIYDLLAEVAEGQDWKLLANCPARKNQWVDLNAVEFRQA